MPDTLKKCGDLAHRLCSEKYDTKADDNSVVVSDKEDLDNSQKDVTPVQNADGTLSKKTVKTDT
jgi:hypothetical protein